MNRSDRNLIKKLLGDKYDPKKKYGFKGTRTDLSCRIHQFKIGKTYGVNGDIVVCSNGFHYCENLGDVHDYYDFGYSRLFIIEDVGHKRHRSKNKIATSAIKLVKEIPYPAIGRRLKKYGIKVFNFKKPKIFNRQDLNLIEEYIMNMGADIILQENQINLGVLNKGIYRVNDVYDVFNGYLNTENISLMRPVEY